MKTGGSRRGARRVALSVSTILAAGIAVPALAQVTPVRQSIDANGVDLFSGAMSVSSPAVTIGPADGGLTYQERTSTGSNIFLAEIRQSGSSLTVLLGAANDSFTVSGSTYTNTEGNGSTLTLNSTAKTLTYVRRDGLTIRFDQQMARQGLGSASGRAIDLVAPDGTKYAYSYDRIEYCASSKPGGNGDICTSRGYDYRVANVRNSFGYELRFSYKEMESNDSSTIGGVDLISFNTRTGVTLSNLATGGSVQQAFGVNYTSGFTNYVYSDARGTTVHRWSSGTQLAGIKPAGQLGETTTVTYSGVRVSSVTNAAGTTTYASSDDTGAGERTVVATNAASQPTTYVFSLGSQRMLRMINALNQTTSWTYDGSGRMTRTTQPEGNFTELTYDARGNVTQAVQVAKSGSGLANITTSASFPSTCTNVATCNQPTSTTDARGKVTTYTYDATHGGVLTATAPVPASGAVQPQTRYGYTQLTDSVTGQAAYRLTSVSTCQTTASCAGGADEVKTTIGYETGNLKPVSMSTGAGDGSFVATTAVTYDTVGNVASVDGPLPGTGDTTTFTYDGARRRTGVLSADPDGGGAQRRRATKVAYNGYDQPIRTELGIADANWANYAVVQQANASYDAYGRKTSDTVTAGTTTYGQTDYAYDGLGRLQSTTVRLNGAGTDRVTVLGYDALDRVISTTSGYGTASQATEITNSYRPNGQAEMVTDAEGNRTTYVFDGFDRLKQTLYPMPTKGATTSNANDYEELTYDAGGNVTARRLRDGNSISYTYDNLGRLTKKTRPALGSTNAVLSYGYDNLGRVTTASGNGAATLTLGYDALGRQTSEASASLGTTGWQYDLAGRMTRQTWTDGFYVSYTYRPTGEVSSIVEGGSNLTLASFAYDDLGRRVSVTRGNGTVTSYGYDAVSRLGTLTQNLAGTASDVTATFEYDWASQLRSVARTNDAYAWTGTSPADQPYAANGLNQYSNVGAGSLGYDSRGNLATTGGASYAYTADNQLRSGPGETLVYDNLDRLLSIASEGRTLRYAGASLIAEQATSGGAIAARYVHGPGSDEALVWYAGAGTSDRRWLHADERGSIVAVSDAGGNALAINSYDEYGVPGSGNMGRFQYTGQTWLPTLGLYNYKARMYSSRLGRFLQTDPIGYGDGMNWYNYVGGDPVNGTDPTGTSLLSKWMWDCIGNCAPNSGYWNTGNAGLGTPSQLAEDQMERAPNGIVTPKAIQPIRNATCPPGSGGDVVVCGNRLPQNGDAPLTPSEIDDIVVTGRLSRPSTWLRGAGSLRTLPVKLLIELLMPGEACCFTAGTLVSTPSGPKAIETLKVGDSVISRSDKTGETAAKPIVAITPAHERRIWTVTVSYKRDDGRWTDERYETTDDHPWRTVDNQWVTSASLKHGQVLARENGTAIVAAVVDTKATKLTYNLEVADFHTYFVGEAETWVHNECDYPALNASKLGYSLDRSVGRQHGQPVFRNGRQYISRDVDQHSGGYWKSFELRGGVLVRTGTWDQGLITRIGK